MSISSQHDYQRTPETLRWEFEKGLITTKGYLYYLIKADREDGNRLRIANVKTFCQEHGISKSSYYKAISELKAEGRINTKRNREVHISFPDELP